MEQRLRSAKAFSAGYYVSFRPLCCLQQPPVYGSFSAVTDATSNRREPVKYAWVGDTSIAYQVLGSGPIDLIYMQGFLSNVELNWEHPLLARFLRELARFSRLIIVDRRGIGCSERFTPADTPPIEALVDDVTAVIDAESSDRPVMFATGDCVFIAALFAASHPDRLSGLVLYGGASTWRKTEEISWGMTGPELEKDARTVRDELGKGLWFKQANPSIASDRREIAWGGRYERLSLTPGSVYPDRYRRHPAGHSDAHASAAPDR
jgi:pimeloyl-ACP methyl ester carboxylesterase